VKLGEYTSLDRRDISLDFQTYIKALELPFMDYVAIGVQDTVHKKSTSIMSSDEWQKTFKKLNLAEDDPVRNAAFSTNAKYFSFDEIDCQNSAGREVMRQRKQHGIENGLVFMERRLSYNFMLTLGTDFKDLNTYRYLIDYHAGLQKVFADLIDLVTPLTQEYQSR
jgi:hypothetical protein